MLAVLYAYILYVLMCMLTVLLLFKLCMLYRHKNILTQNSCDPYGVLLNKCNITSICLIHVFGETVQHENQY